MFGWFESLVEPYPDAPPATPPRGFFAFLWECTRGLRRYIVAMTVCTSVIGAFEALLFSMMGHIVNWLAAVKPAELWATERGTLLLLGAVLAASVSLIALQTTLKQQALAGNFPMLLRWNFHRLLLSQSMGFYQDEFAGRIATKVMQTALAVRDVWLILAELLVFVIIYFVTLLAVLGGFDVAPPRSVRGLGRVYIVTLRFFVPRLGRVAREQADARSLMTGRITDAYTNIATVKLFSHARREAGYAKAAMQEFLATVQRQMRLVTGFEIVNHALSMALIASTAGATLWLWIRGEVSVGAVAAATAMALRLNGISHWVMWEMAALFEHIGTVQDGINTLSRVHAVVDKPDARPLVVARGEIRFERVSFSYGGKRDVIDDLSLVIRPGEKIGLVGRSGAGKSTIVNLLLRFYDSGSGRILIDGQDIAQCTQESLRAQIGMVTQDTSLLHRSVRDNILYGKPDATDADMETAARRARGARLHRRTGRREGPTRIRRPRRRAGGQAVGRPAPAYRHRARHAEKRADPAARRGDQRPRLRGRGGDPAEPLPVDGGQDGRGHRASAVDDRRHGSADRARPRAHCRGRRAPHARRRERPLCTAVGAPERRLPRRSGRRRGRRRPQAGYRTHRRSEQRGRSVERGGSRHPPGAGASRHISRTIA